MPTIVPVKRATGRAYKVIVRPKGMTPYSKTINPLINEVCLREAESALKELQSIQDNANLIDPQTRPRSNKDVCSDILTLAKESYYGLGDALEDYGEAERLFMQAAKLKCPEAFLYLGDMQYIGLGCRESKAKALDYYRKGVELECNPCRIRMAVVYVSEGHVDNAMKCIKQYMDGITHTNSDVGEIADDIYRFLVVAKVSKIDIGIADFKPSSSIMSALIRRAEKEFEECDDSSMHNFYKSMLIGLGVSIEKPGDASVEGIVDKVDWGCTFVNLENGLRGIIKGFEYKRHIGERGKFRVNVNDGSMAQIELVEWL